MMLWVDPFLDGCQIWATNIFGHHRLYITYTFDCGFLFDLDQINICRDIQKIEIGNRVYTNPTKDMQQNKEAKNSRK